MWAWVAYFRGKEIGGHDMILAITIGVKGKSFKLKRSEHWEASTTKDSFLNIEKMWLWQ